MGLRRKLPELTEQQRNRYNRYRGIVPIKVLRKTQVEIAGVGAVGAALARQLAVLGIGSIEIHDFDKITHENLGTQGWREFDVGDAKVDVLKLELQNLNPQIRVDAHFDHWRERLGLYSTPRSHNALEIMAYGKNKNRPLIFVPCVDSMATRKAILERVNELGWPDLVVDSRLGAMTSRVITAKSWDDWIPTWFPDGEGLGAACTERGTYHSAVLTAGLMVAYIVQFLRGNRIPRDVLCDWNNGIYNVKGWYDGEDSDSSNGVGSGGSARGDGTGEAAGTPVAAAASTRGDGAQAGG